MGLFRTVRHDILAPGGTPRIARFLLRLGLGLVFLVFGIDKFFTPQIWMAFIPEWLALVMPFSQFALIYAIGAVEAVLGAALLLGIYVRTAAFVTALLLLAIIFSVGYNDIAIRDAGLLAMALALLFLGGPRRRK